MNIFKIIGGIGAGVLAAAGLIVAGRTGLGKSEATEPADTTEPAGGGDAPADTETNEENESSGSESESDSADA